jgi:hypothetical protein
MKTFYNAGNKITIKELLTLCSVAMRKEHRNDEKGTLFLRFHGNNG